jgi:hypothetical protein
VSLFHRWTPPVTPAAFTSAIDDPRLAQLGRFTPEGQLTPGYGSSYLFFVGRDDVHSILVYLLRNEKLAFIFSMFGYDDPEINEAIMAMLKTPTIRVQMTLDKSQSKGVHERQLLAADEATNPDFLNSCAIGESATHQINHTKSGVLVGQGIYFEGSTNLSNSGEGVGISLKTDSKNPVGFRSQNNTLVVSTSPTNLSRLTERLNAEHLIAVAQMSKSPKTS